jgi:hypothetical protein
LTEEAGKRGIYIEYAAALKVDFIMTGDKTLIEIQDYMAIKIVSPKDFLSSYRRFKRLPISRKEMKIRGHAHALDKKAEYPL